MADNSLLRPEFLSLSSEQLSALMPYFVVFGGTVLTMLLSVAKSFKPKWSVFIFTSLTALAGLWASFQQIKIGPVSIFNNMMVVDTFSAFFNLVFLGTLLLTAFASFRYLDQENLQHPEYYLLLMFSALGMMLMTSALDLIVIFISLEIMSLAVYALVGFRRADRRSNEASVKYFILGSAASAVMLYGTALLYGATGSINIADISKWVIANPSSPSMLFVIGAWLVILGFLFKVASVPFHMWMPDVYEGAPTPVTGFMTTGLKAAAFATFIRVFISLGYGKGLMESVQASLHNIVWISAVATMLIGNIVALTQTNLKRMLAYSSIAHTGYLLIGLLSGGASDYGYAPMVMYLAIYAIMNLGAFVVLGAIAGREDHGLNLHDLSGLAARRPWMAFAMAVFLFSMAGLPPTAGFAAKYLLFYSAVQAGEIWIVVLAVLCSAISVYYYLRVLVYMYMRDPVGSPAATRVSVWATAVLASTVIATVQIGVLPQAMVNAAKRAVSAISFGT